MKSSMMILVQTMVVAGTLVSAAFAGEDGNQRADWTPPEEGDLATFLGEPQCDIQNLFEGGRFPNVVVALDGSVVATWGRNEGQVRRSTDGGTNWGPLTTAGPGMQGGGATVDEVSGDILLFLETQVPVTDRVWTGTVYRSQDHGETWEADPETVIHPLHRRSPGVIPTMHMSENGITLRFGEHRGRLLRPANQYLGATVPGGPADAFTTAIYSEDGGLTWDTSGPFPAFGTNEAAVAELTDGRILFISRRHRGTDGLDTFQKHLAWSHDGGETWRDLSVSPVLPDGNTNSPYGLMHGLVRLPVQGRDILVFSNIQSDARRERGTVWASFDGGETWPWKRVVHEGPFAYSSLAVGRAGTPSEGLIYLLFEGGADHHYEGGLMARFNLAWILGGEPSGDGDLPEWIADQVPAAEGSRQEIDRSD